MGDISPDSAVPEMKRIKFEDTDSFQLSSRSEDVRRYLSLDEVCTRMLAEEALSRFRFG